MPKTSNIALLVWRLAARASRQADGNKSVAVATVDAWCLAVGRVPPGGMV